MKEQWGAGQVPVAFGPHYQPLSPDPFDQVVATNSITEN